MFIFEVHRGHTTQETVELRAWKRQGAGPDPANGGKRIMIMGIAWTVLAEAAVDCAGCARSSQCSDTVYGTITVSMTRDGNTCENENLHSPRTMPKVLHALHTSMVLRSCKGIHIVNTSQESLVSRTRRWVTSYERRRTSVFISV